MVWTVAVARHLPGLPRKHLGIDGIDPLLDRFNAGWGTVQVLASDAQIEFIPIYGMLGLQRKEATAMGT